jgi:hypothetical protein
MRFPALGLLLLACSPAERPPTTPATSPDGAGPDLPRPRLAVDAAAGDTGLASTCGGPGQACCSGNLCAGGGCCVERTCVKEDTSCRLLEGMCLKGSCGGGGCGGIDQPCCARGSCTAPGSVCAGGVCASCGGYGQECCPAAGCLAPGTACTGAGRCLPCGEPGQTCCAGQCSAGGCCTANRCVAAGASCGAEGRCEAGRCDRCGAEGQACCLGPRRSPCEGAGLACDPATSTCLPTSGAEGQACGAGAPCGGGLICNGEPARGPGLPPLQICRACGGDGQACCPSGTGPPSCAEGGCCASNICVAAGAACASPLGPGGTCLQGRCGCGQNGQDCCLASARPPCDDPDAICAAPGPPPAPGMDPLAMPTPRTCQPCGQPGQPCCPGNRCGSGCCVRSGIADGGSCVAEGAACGPGGASCRGGTCGACGGAGQPCCAGACTAPLHACRLIAGHGERCLPCGSRGEACCTDQLPFALWPTGQVCPGGINLTCRAGFCTER